MQHIYNSHRNTLKRDLITNVLKPREYGEDTKDITAKLLSYPISLSEHITTMNETDRTIVGLLWHENVIDVFNNIPVDEAASFYADILSNICFADYIDRVTFQRQIWIFNELSSLLKTFYSTYKLHNLSKNKKNDLSRLYNSRKPKDIRFTKALTKYSTEYNNYIFIQDMCQRLSMDKNDLIAFFQENRQKQECHEFIEELESYDITQLDINRINRYLDWLETNNSDT